MGLNKLKLVFEKNIVIKVVRVLIVIGYFLSELCPNKGMPLLNSAGNAQRCASTMDCGDGTYSCQSSNIDGYKYCCPAKLLITGTVIYYTHKVMIPLICLFANLYTWLSPLITEMCNFFLQFFCFSCQKCVQTLGMFWSMMDIQRGVAWTLSVSAPVESSPVRRITAAPRTLVRVRSNSSLSAYSCL